MHPGALSETLGGQDHTAASAVRNGDMPCGRGFGWRPAEGEPDRLSISGDQYLIHSELVYTPLLRCA